MINALKDQDGAARIAESFNTAFPVIGMEFDHVDCGSKDPQRSSVFGKVCVVFKNPLDGTVYRSNEVRDLTWDHLVAISQEWGGRKAVRVPVIREAMKRFLDRVQMSVERARAGFELPSKAEHERKIREWEEEERRRREEQRRLRLEEDAREAREMMIDAIMRIGFSGEDVTEMWREAQARSVMEA